MLSLTLVLSLSLIVTAQMSGPILHELGEFFGVKQWYFLDDKNIADLSSVYFLARNGQPTVLSPNFNDRFCDTLGTIVVTKISFWTVLALIKTSFPRCSWIIQNVYHENLVSELLPLRSSIIFYESIERIVRLTFVQKPCLHCSVLVKSVNVTSGKVAKIMLNDFADFPDTISLNGSVVDVTVDAFSSCEPWIADDPFVLIQCYHLEVINMVAAKYDFRVNRVLPIFREYPYNFPNGSQGGLVLHMAQRLADMSAASMVITEDRLQSSDNAWPTFEFDAAMFVKSGQNKVEWLGFLNPFNLFVWLAIGGTIIVGSFVLILTTGFLRYQKNQKQLIILFPIFYALQIFSLQSSTNIANTISSKIANIVLFIAALTVIQAYSGSVISFLTTKKEHYPFSTLDDLIKDGRFQILTRAPHFLNIHLRVSKMTNLSALMLSQDEMVANDQDGFQKLCDGWITYVIEEILYQPALKEYACQIIQTPVTYTTEFFAILLPGNYPLTERVRIGTAQARSSGFDDCLEKFIAQETRPTNVINYFLPVSIIHVAPMFLFLAIFIIIGWVILGLEIIHYDKHVQRKLDNAG